MKLIVILAVIALSNGDKLDNTYLPPSYAQTSGGSGNFLQTPTPGQSSNEYQRNNNFGQNLRGPGRNGVAQSSNDYAQARNDFSQTGNNFAQTGNGFGQNGNDYAHNTNGFTQNGNKGNVNNDFGNFDSRPERTQAAFERNAGILRQDTQNDGETYSFSYETENGIIAEENGVATNGVEAEGGFSYTGDDGQVYSIRYTADQNGFVPQGDHIPTPPPVPEEILRALEQNARDEAAGIYDDGSYNEAKYGSGDDLNSYNSNKNYDNSNKFNNGNTYNTPSNGDEDTIVTNSALFRNDNRPGFRNQAPNAPSYNPNFRNQGNQAGFNGPAAQNSGFRNQGNQGFGNQAPSGANKAYLPPLDNQRSGGNDRNGFARRQPLSGRNGYQY